jgi:hypothetical protein
MVPNHSDLIYTMIIMFVNYLEIAVSGGLRNPAVSLREDFLDPAFDLTHPTT